MLSRINDYVVDGLKNCTYDLLHEEFSDNIYHIIVDVKHKEHRLAFPEQFDFSGYTHEKYKRIMSGKKPHAKIY